MICSHVLKVDCAQPENLAGLDKKLQTFWDLDALGVREGEDCLRQVHQDYRAEKWSILRPTSMEGTAPTAPR